MKRIDLSINKKNPEESFKKLTSNFIKYGFLGLKQQNIELPFLIHTLIPSRKYLSEYKIIA